MAEILFLTHLLPYPLDAGAKVRAHYMLRYLAGQHRVTLVSFVRPDDRPESVRYLQGICAAVLTVPVPRSTWGNLRAGVKGLLTGLPMVVARDESAGMSDCLRELAQQVPFDVVHADQLAMAGYGQQAARLIASACGRRPATVLDEHNAIYQLTRRMAADEAQPLRRWLTAREARAFVGYEAGMCRAYDAVFTVTAEDRAHLLALYGPDERAARAAGFNVLPICVDPAGVEPVAARSGPPVILHLGTMFWPPNVAGVLWFAREVLPLVRRRMPEARFVVVGKNPPAAVTALAADPGVEIAGYVADVRPHLEAAGVFVVPLHAGGGMRVKILDAWLWGLPVVSTPLGAEGLLLCDGENILLAEDPQAFADATVRLLHDSALNRRLRANGRAWVEEHYAWRTVYRRVDDVYTTLTRTGRAT
jgi:polysaccharide biosynthesis protein PslH